MTFVPNGTAAILQNSGIRSEQLVWDENTQTPRVAVTRVTVLPGAEQPRHIHASSEQIWIAVSGAGELLLADDERMPFAAGDAVRFADNDIHGLYNSSDDAFIYISVTAPPLNFRNAYQK